MARGSLRCRILTSGELSLGEKIINRRRIAKLLLGSGFRSQNHSESILSARKPFVPLDEAAGKILAKPIAADRDGPPYDRVMMDGYALQATDSKLGGFELGGTSVADIAQAEARNEPGAAVEVMTGAILPMGTDAVVPYEWTVGRVRESSCSKNLRSKGSVHPFSRIGLQERRRSVRRRNFNRPGGNGHCCDLRTPDGRSFEAAENCHPLHGRRVGLHFRDPEGTSVTPIKRSSNSIGLGPGGVSSGLFEPFERRSQDRSQPAFGVHFFS